MSTITKILLHQLTTLTPRDLQGVKAIASGVFGGSKLNSVELPNTCEAIYGMAFCDSTNLQKIILPSSVKKIGTHAFARCSALNNVTLNLPSDCIIQGDAFVATPYYNNATSDLCSSDGKILIKGVSSQLPSSVVNLAGNSGGANLVVNSHLSLPDRIQIIVGHITGTPTKMTIGSSTHYMGTDAIPDTVTTLICRQPSGMKITLPIAGEAQGLTYKKDARNVAIYTDNEDIKKYNWSGDNVTATFYPLSQAPA